MKLRQLSQLGHNSKPQSSHPRNFPSDRGLVPNFVVLAERPPITDNVINNAWLDISTKELVDNKLDVVQQGQTRVVLIIGKDQDPRIAAAAANETARQLRDTGPLRPTELIQIVALAPVPTNPSSEIYLILGLSALAGLFLAALIAVLIELKRDRPQTLSWAASRMDLPILGSFKLNKVLPRRRRWFGRIQSPDKWPTPAQVWWVVMEAFHKMLKMTDDTSLAEAKQYRTYNCRQQCQIDPFNTRRCCRIGASLGCFR